MLGKERLEKDALLRIKWDKNLAPSEYTVSYLDRFSRKLKEVLYSDILLDGDYILVGDSAIPMHRIREIRCKGEVVWAKRRT